MSLPWKQRERTHRCMEFVEQAIGGAAVIGRNELPNSSRSV